MIGFFSWLIGSKAGRYIAVTVIATASMALAIATIYRKGAAAEKSKQTQASLDRLRNRISTDDELSKMAPDARRAELTHWLRDGE